MKRIAVIVTLTLLIGIVSATLAQEATETPAPAPTQSLTDLATQVWANADDARRAADDSRRYAEDARTEAQEQLSLSTELLGMFQNVTQTIFAIFGIAAPVLAIAAGYLGFNRLTTAQKELGEARERFEKEMREKQDDLTKSA
jgi:hypothetical protein